MHISSAQSLHWDQIETDRSTVDAALSRSANVQHSFRPVHAVWKLKTSKDLFHLFHPKSSKDHSVSPLRTNRPPPSRFIHSSGSEQAYTQVCWSGIVIIMENNAAVHVDSIRCVENEVRMTDRTSQPRQLEQET